MWERFDNVFNLHCDCCNKPAEYIRDWPGMGSTPVGKLPNMAYNCLKHMYMDIEAQKLTMARKEVIL